MRGCLLTSNGWLNRSTETGRGEIYLSRFPEPIGGRFQVSRNGGTDMAWSKDGRELFYRNGSEIWSARIDANGPAGEPRRLFTLNVASTDSVFDAAPDGRFLVVVDDQTGASANRVAAHLQHRRPTAPGCRKVIRRRPRL